MIRLYVSIVIYSAALIFGMSSCASLMGKMYGINQLEGVNKEKIHEFYSTIDFHDIETDKVIIDSLIFQTLREHDNDSIKKDLSQPIQIHYFQNEKLVSFHANCYAKGSLKNLDWNYQDRFESFIPRSVVKDFTPYPNLHRLNKATPNINLSKEGRIVIAIFWTRMLEDISKDAINTVLRNIREFNEKEDVRLVLINTDSFFSKI